MNSAHLQRVNSCGLSYSSFCRDRKEGDSVVRILKKILQVKPEALVGKEVL